MTNPNIYLLSRESFFHDELKIRWTLGWDIVAKKEVAVPLSLAQLQTGKNREAAMFVFQSTSNGLAAGVHFVEAVAQGLTEVIERDGLACNALLSAAKGSDYPLGRVIPESIPYPLVQDVLARFRDADVEALLFDCTTNDLKVPTYSCVILDKNRNHTGMAMGYGANLNPETAMLRAMTESVLGRSETIQGVRENFSPCEYQMNHLIDNEGTKQQIWSIPCAADGATYPNLATDSFHEDIEIMIRILKANGFEQVIVLDMTPPESDVPVVRVIVPGLEGAPELSCFGFGQRAYAYVREAAS